MRTQGIRQNGRGKDTKKLIINEFEAQAVRIIFEDYIAGNGYTKILNKLDSQGFKTKRGALFGKNSLHEILKNGKYMGVFIYNYRACKSVDSTFNRHKYKSNEDIIKIENGIPAIISKELYEAVQVKMLNLKRKSGCYNAKETYLLSGKIYCGECNSSFTGNSRKERNYVGYRCSKSNGKIKCKNSEIKREVIEKLVLDKLSDKIFNNDIIPSIAERINSYISERDSQYTTIKKGITDRIKVIDKEINNITEAIASKALLSLMNKLSTLESEKSVLENELSRIDREVNSNVLNLSDIKKLFNKAKKLFSQGTLLSQKKLIDTFVDKVIVYKNKIEIHYNIISPPDNTPPKTRKDKNSPNEFLNFSDLFKVICNS